MASDLISRKTLLEAMDEVERKLEMCMCIPSWATALKCIRDFPTVDAAPVVHGEWKISSDGYYPYCSICNYRPKGGEMTKHCPDCGAKMNGGIGTAEDICKTTNIPCIKCNPGPCEHRKKG